MVSEEYRLDMEWFPRIGDVPLGPKERYETLDDAFPVEIESVETALRKMMSEDSELNLVSPKTRRALYRATGASHGSIGMAIYLVSQGSSVADELK